MNDVERDKILEKIDSNVDEIMIWKSALDVRCEAHRTQTNEVRKTVYGNPGSVNGLQFEVSRLSNCKKSLTKLQEFFIFILRVLVIFGIIEAVTWLLQIKGE